MSEVTIVGPKAPKDPTKKRPGFCIMKNKSVCGSPMPDGTGVCFIYESDGRMIDAARLVGNITDESMASMLKYTKDFRKLVHSVGVSIETEDGEDADFVLQMYGKTDTYGSGTLMRMTVTGDGMEYLLDLSKVDWSDDDDVIGQIRFVFKKGGDFGKVTVRLYLNDGYSAPAEEDENPVDFSSKAYKEMIAKSLMHKGNNARIKRAIDKAREGKDVTIGFIGGSITQGAGAVPINKECYARKIFEGFCDIAGRGYEDNVHYSKAGVGGTPSELGILRYERDILKDGKVNPDLVVVEFAVNDEGDETKGECFDSLIRKIYNGQGKPAVIILFAVFSNDLNLQDRLKPVGFAYDIPMVSTKDSVVDQFKSKDRVVSKSQYFYDCFHPTNTGHRIMADGVLNLLRICDEEKPENEVDIDNIKAPIGGDFEKVILVDRVDNTVGAVINEGDFTDVDKELQAVERDMDMTVTPQFPNNWFYKGTEGRTGKPFSIDVDCKTLFIIFKDSASNNDGIAKVIADGKEVLNLNPKDVGWTHCDPVIVVRGKENKKHHVEVVPTTDKNFTILGFGVVK